MDNFRTKILKFSNSKKEYPHLIIFIAGLYPFLHYYSNNISEATSWQQLLFLVFICFLLPQALLVITPLIFKIKFIKTLKPYHVAILNSVIFLGLLGFLVFYLNKKMMLLLLCIAIGIGFLLVRYLKKIAIIQLLLAVMSFISLLPKLKFHFEQTNSTWAVLSDTELKTKFKVTPNIFIIQPDGYVNFSEINEAPYNYDNSEFENWLISKGFKNYKGFRSNYYSTATSNSSMFAMKHHHYSNTNLATLRTHKSNEAIIGKYNNVLKILKNNNYKSYLITDNSYFLIDRKPSRYDYCNLNTENIPYFNSGTVKGSDILIDFSKALDTITQKNNFFFIEKTIPSHINYKKISSKGKKVERISYLSRLEISNNWIRSLIKEINNFDKEALIVIVADHGGFVGFDYQLQATTVKLDNEEIKSTFSSTLSIKWPNDIYVDSLSYKTNVNLFRNLFYTLSKNKHLLENSEKDNSFLPLKNEIYKGYYKYIDDSDQFVFEKISSE